MNKKVFEAQAAINIPGCPVAKAKMLVAIRTCMVITATGGLTVGTPWPTLFRVAVAVSDDTPDSLEEVLKGTADSMLFNPVKAFIGAPTADDAVWLSLWFVQGLYAATTTKPFDMQAMEITGVCEGLVEQLKGLPDWFGVSSATLVSAAAIEESASKFDPEAAEFMERAWVEKTGQSDDHRWMQPYVEPTIEDNGKAAHLN